jgi:hypothetical protein
MGLKLKALSAEDATKGLTAVATVLWPNQPINLKVNTNLPGLACSVEGPGKDLLSLTATFLKQVEGRRHVVAESAAVRWANKHDRQITYAGGDQIVADINIQNPESPDDALAWLAVIEKAFAVTALPDLIVGAVVPEAQRQALQLQERTVTDLRGEVERLADFLAKMAREDAEHRRAETAKLDADHRERVDKLNAAHQQRIDDVEEKRRASEDALAERERALAAEKSAFDTSEAKGMRRRLLTQLMEVLKESESLKLSDDTSKKRLMIHAFTLVLACVAALVAYKMGIAFLYGSGGVAAGSWHFGLPMATGTVTLFGTLVYYLKWNDRWFREHAEGEFASKRYKSDMLRASWLAELVSERAQAGQPELPPEMMDSFTQNLFRGSAQLAEAEHPFEQVTGLIKRARKLEVGGGRLLLDVAQRRKKEPAGKIEP